MPRTTNGFATSAIIVTLIVLTGIVSIGYFAGINYLESVRKTPLLTQPSPETNTATHFDTSNTTATPSTSQHTLDLTSLPLGDNKYATSPKQGYVYSCQTTFNGGGAFTQGPWIYATTKTWDLTRKVSVDGTVSWPNATWKLTQDGTTRTATFNDLPQNHTTGTYPIAKTDDAYNYDRNPNSISAHDLTLAIPTQPQLLSSPQCVGGEVGVMLSGVLIFNAFDAGGRDAVAMEVQDSCQGHPQEAGYYHYHGWSSCLTDQTTTTEHSALVGYAFDGFGIFGLKGENGTELSSANLDECHGHTHAIEWDGKTQNMYHYHMTQDFPYSVSCFRAKPVVKALSAGGQGGSGGPGKPPPGGPGGNGPAPQL